MKGENLMTEKLLKKLNSRYRYVTYWTIGQWKYCQPFQPAKGYIAVVIIMHLQKAVVKVIPNFQR